MRAPDGSGSRRPAATSRSTVTAVAPAASAAPAVTPLAIRNLRRVTASTVDPPSGAADVLGGAGGQGDQLDGITRRAGQHRPGARGPGVHAEPGGQHVGAARG